MLVYITSSTNCYTEVSAWDNANSNTTISPDFTNITITNGSIYITNCSINISTDGDTTGMYVYTCIYQ